MLYLTKTNSLLRRVYPAAIWKIKDNNKSLFLTFDDGPCPGVTDVVLEELKKWDAKATFFCLGQQIEKYPELFQRILKEGHAVGNHSFSHPHAWRTSAKKFLEDVALCQKLHPFKLFRPPYGKMGPRQYKALKKQFKIVMWDVLSGDFDLKRKAEDCVESVQEKVDPGSIVVYHDSERSKHLMLPSLKRCLEHFSAEGFRFKSIPC